MKNYEEYRKIDREIQDSLDEDDSVRCIARDLISENVDGVRDFLVDVLEEENPVEKLLYDLY